jgi:DNA repair photolyase
MNHDFEDIEVKRNAPEILENQLKRKRCSCMIGTGAMCDPYIPLEENLGITRKCLELIYKYNFGIAIQTKSTKILRDLDILTAINERTKCVVQMTLTTFDEKLCRIIEPNVSATSERFAALEKFRDAGIPTVVWLSPILPFINDSEENIRGILDYCIRAEVKGIICFGFGVTLREGDREYFYKKLDEHFPGIKQKYIRTFGNNYECSSPNNARLWRIFDEICSRNNIIYHADEVFSYMNKFEEKRRQLEFFNID